MNDDTLKGAAQKIGGHLEEAAGALVGDQHLKDAGREDQLKGTAREAWGNVKDAAGNLIDQARAAKLDAEVKTDRVETFEHQHETVVKP
jgi:uncharacterized protein YjbJ (UPF0337 family)